jgi:uncharacterized membrane protein YphA (DoxX/SURF4 family)
MDILTILLALTLLGHGIGHVMGFLASWTDLPMGFTKSPWIFSRDITIQSSVGKAFGILWLISMGAFIASAIGLLMGQSWWTTVAFIASFLSLIAFIPWWNTFAPGPKQAIVLVDVVVIAVLLGPWKGELLARIGAG